MTMTECNDPARQGGRDVSQSRLAKQRESERSLSLEPAKVKGHPTETEDKHSDSNSRGADSSTG
jgi:hypothetical protein